MQNENEVEVITKYSPDTCITDTDVLETRKTVHTVKEYDKHEIDNSITLETTNNFDNKTISATNPNKNEPTIPTTSYFTKLKKKITLKNWELLLINVICAAWIPFIFLNYKLLDNSYFTQAPKELFILYLSVMGVISLLYIIIVIKYKFMLYFYFSVVIGILMLSTKIVIKSVDYESKCQ